MDTPVYVLTVHWLQKWKLSSLPNDYLDVQEMIKLIISVIEHKTSTVYFGMVQTELC